MPPGAIDTWQAQKNCYMALERLVKVFDSDSDT